MPQQLSLFGDDAFVPIPECDDLMLKIYGTPENIARLMIEAARKWKRQHPGMDVMEVIAPNWKEYIRVNL